LTSIPTIRLKDVEDIKDVKNEAYLKKENEALDNMPIPCTIFCSRRKFLELTKEIKAPRYIPLNKLSLVICDNVHEALRDETAKTQLSDIFALVRYEIIFLYYYYGLQVLIDNLIVDHATR
jgi:hypothetical protein